MADYQVADHPISEVLAEIEAGTLTPQQALEQERAQGEHARSSLIERLEAMLTPSDPPATAPAEKEKPVAKKEDAVRVRTNSKKVRGNAAFFDPEQKVTIGSKPVDVKRTPFIRTHLLSEELVEAK